MKTLKILILAAICSMTVNAQTYKIDFAGKGVSFTVDSVKIENLSQCTSLTIKGTDTLVLSSSGTGIDYISDNVNFVNVYPNPSSGSFTVEIRAAIENNADIAVYDISGNSIFQRTVILKKGSQKLFIRGISIGSYILKIESEFCKYSSKLISLVNSKSLPEISTIEIKEKPQVQNISGNVEKYRDIKAVQSVASMSYHEGDTLKLTGISGIYKTIKMYIPKGNETVSFNFTNCTDADGNHYSVVQIGSQLWMAENLRTTKYRDGAPIPNVQDSASWGSITTGAYCNFHNDTTEGNYYGRLYNFYAVDDARNLAPSGWHVATNSEWNILEKFLDPTVDTSATKWMGRGTIIGRILKERCNTRWQYLDTTSGLNSAGFNALCSNFRNNTGAWSLAPDNNHDNAFWTSTSYSNNTAWGLSLRWCFGDIYVIPLINKRAGSSVRCIKD